MRSNNSRNPLIRCPFCNKQMKGKTLAGHVKRLHATNSDSKAQIKTLPASLLEGVEIKSPELVKEIKSHFIDEHGFLISTDLMSEPNTDEHQGQRLYNIAKTRPVVEPSIFEKIRSLDSNIPGAKVKKLRPEPDQKILCPVCHKTLPYKDLFNHVKNKHREENAKFILARFNQRYEIWAKNNRK